MGGEWRGVGCIEVVRIGILLVVESVRLVFFNFFWGRNCFVYV